MMNADDLNRLGMRGPVREMYLFMRKHGISEVRLKKRGTRCDAKVFMDLSKEDQDKLPKLTDLIGLFEDSPVDIGGGWEAAVATTESKEEPDQ